MDPHLFNFTLPAVIGQFDLLGIEHNRIFDFAVIR